eukprot:1903869-Rhodomonas_salina.3
MHNSFFLKTPAATSDVALVTSQVRKQMAAVLTSALIAGMGSSAAFAADAARPAAPAVSYTHLTLPTICSV